MAHNKKDGVLPPPTCSSAGDGRYYTLDSVSVPQEKVERVDAAAVVDFAPAPLPEPVPMVETVAFEPARPVAVIETRVVEPQPVVRTQVIETTVFKKEEESSDRFLRQDELAPMPPAVPLVNPVIAHEPIIAA